MSKPFKIYYNDQGLIKTITTENLPGNFIFASDEQVNDVSNHISRYKIENEKLINVKKSTMSSPTLQFCTDFDLGKAQECYITAKNNLFLCEQSVTIKPTDFDDTKYSWVKYDS